MMSQAGIAEIRSTLERILSVAEARRLQLRYEEPGDLPAAAIVQVKGVELRLEKDYPDELWTIATNDATPRLLDRINEQALASEIVKILEQSVARFGGWRPIKTSPPFVLSRRAQH
jgi:hypothetical protein